MAFTHDTGLQLRTTHCTALVDMHVGTTVSNTFPICLLRSIYCLIRQRTQLCVASRSNLKIARRSPGFALRFHRAAIAHLVATIFMC
jgi:hypothetical protein